MPRSTPQLLVGSAFALAALTAGCAASSGASAGAGDGGQPAAAPGGSIDISGSSTVEPISNAVREKFVADNPDVAISVSGPGTGDGFQQFCVGQTDISDASRPIASEEAALCESNGVSYVELKVGIDGIAVLTSAGNDTIECIDFPAIYGIVGPESTGFGNWSDGQPIADELGTQTQLPDAPLTIIAPGEESGTYDSFVEIVLEGYAEERGQEPISRPDYQASANDNVIVEGISQAESAFGWVGYAFYDENRDVLKALQVAADGESACVEATPETIASGEYPLSRPLFIYVSKASIEDNPAVEEFVDFYLSDEGIASVSEVGYVSLTDDALAETRKAWESFTEGDA